MNIFGTKLIFRATSDGFEHKVFTQKVHGHSNIIVLFLAKSNNVYGGYTKTGWNKEIPSGYYSSDKNAFIFGIRSSEGYKPSISNVKQDGNAVSKALSYCTTDYAIFGSVWVIYISWYGRTKCVVRHQTPENFESFEHEYCYQLSGGVKFDDKAIEIEVFQMI